MSKPHITRKNGLYECYAVERGKGIYGYGETPVKAYWDWITCNLMANRQIGNSRAWIFDR